MTAIVNMRMHSDYEESRYEGVKYLHLPTVDNTAPSMDNLIKGADFTDAAIKNGGQVYIHCKHGLGRGPTMTLPIKNRVNFRGRSGVGKKKYSFLLIRVLVRLPDLKNLKNITNLRMNRSVPVS